MSAKIQVAQAVEIAKKIFPNDPSKMREFVEAMNQASQPEKDEQEPKSKKQFVILLSDMDGKLPKQDLTGWVVQIPEAASPFSLMDRIFKSAYDFNAGKKGRLLPVKSVGESLESVSHKYFKEAELAVKTRMPVAVIVTDNVLPKDESGFRIDKRVHEDRTVTIAAS